MTEQPGERDDEFHLLDEEVQDGEPYRTIALRKLVVRERTLVVLGCVAFLLLVANVGAALALDAEAYQRVGGALSAVTGPVWGILGACVAWYFKD